MAHVVAGADGGFDELWEAINKELSFLHLEMRRVNYVPAPGKAAVRFVGIVNRVRPAAVAGSAAGPLLRGRMPRAAARVYGRCARVVQTRRRVALRRCCACVCVSAKCVVF